MDEIIKIESILRLGGNIEYFAARDNYNPEMFRINFLDYHSEATTLGEAVNRMVKRLRDECILMTLKQNSKNNG